MYRIIVTFSNLFFLIFYLTDNYVCKLSLAELSISPLLYTGAALWFECPAGVCGHYCPLPCNRFPHPLSVQSFWRFWHPVVMDWQPVLTTGLFSALQCFRLCWTDTYTLVHKCEWMGVWGTTMQTVVWASFFHFCLNYSVFNVFNVEWEDYLQYMLTFYCFHSHSLLQPKHWALILVLVLLRFIFFPLFALCVIPGAFYTPLFNSDVAPIVICVAFGASNGYLASISMIHSPS